MSTQSIFVRAMAFSLLFSLLLAACAPAPAATPQTVIQTQVVEVPVKETVVVTNEVIITPTPEPTQPPEPVEITYYTFSAAPDHLEDLDQMIQLFQAEHPNITVKVETAPFNDYFIKLQTLIAGGTAPDVFELNYENFVTYAEKGLLLDLTPMMSVDSSLDPAIYYPRALQAFSYNGMQLGLPATFSTVVLYYNKDLFDKAGVKYPDETWTWDDLLAAAEKLTVKDASGKVTQYALAMEGGEGLGRSAGLGLTVGVGLMVRVGEFAPIEYPLIGLLVLMLVSYGLIRSRNYRFGISFQIWGLGAVGFFAIGFGSENPATALQASLLPAYILASLLLPLWEMVTLVAVSIVIIGLFDMPGMTVAQIGSLVGIVLTTGVLLAISAAFRNALERQRLTELDQVNEELRQIQATLEQRVEERTDELRTATFRAARHASQLQTIAEVAHTVSLVSDLNALLNSICNLLSERFGFYHIGIFLNDETQEYAVLRASNSEGGQRMLERHHRLKIGEAGIVGYVAAQGQARVALDVGDDAVFFDNPDLPDTRSEMALPLIVGSRIIGVLDVQSTEPAAFSDDDIDVMHTLADQIAVAIENARLFGETRRALQEAETIYNRFITREWNRIALERQRPGYLATPAGIQPLAKELDAPEIQAAIRSGKPTSGSADLPTLAVPLRVRGETIGVLHIKISDTRRTWSPADIESVQRVAERAALALESARLLAESEKRAQREQVIGKVGNRIRQTLDLDTVLKTAAEELRQALNLQAAEVRLGLTPSETKARKPAAGSNP